MENQINSKELTLREYYNILVTMCNALEQDPENDAAIDGFVDAAYHLAKADCGHLFPEDLLHVNAAKTPDEGVIITAVKEED